MPVYTTRDLIGNLSHVRRLIRTIKAEAMKKGVRDSYEIANKIFESVEKNNGWNADPESSSDLNIRTMAYLFCVDQATSRRASSGHGHQGEFDFGAWNVCRFGPPQIKLSDGRTAVNRDGRWFVSDDAGSETRATKNDAALFDAMPATRPHIATDVIPVRNIGYDDGEQHIKQVTDNLEMQQIAVDRKLKGWRLIGPLLRSNPKWKLGDAVDYLRDRGDWPDELDE